MKTTHRILNLVCTLALLAGLWNRAPAAAVAHEAQPAASSSAPTDGAGRASAIPPQGLSAAEWASVQSQITAAEYQVTWQRRDGRAAYRAPNRAQGFEAAFDAQGLRVAAWQDGREAWSFGLALRTYNGEPAPAAELSAEREQVSAARGPALREWYQNTPQGIKHGLTISAPPASGAGELTLDFDLTGSLRAEMAPGGGLRLRDARGKAVLAYDGLAVYDAGGRSLPASLALVPGGLRMQIDARQAVYPLNVDPLLYSETRSLHASDAGADDQFGRAAALDGDTLVVGASHEDGGPSSPQADAGAAYVFTRNQDGADTWGQVAILRASDAQAGDEFGWSVAISGDTLVVGALYEDGGPGDPLLEVGAAYVFSRNQGGVDAWGQVALLHASDAQAGDWFGSAVAISGDTIVVGAKYEDGGPGDLLSGAGAAYVFTRNQGGVEAWGQVAILRASDAQAVDFFGSAVAISSDAIVVGAPLENGGPGDPQTDAGAAYVFTRNQGGVEAWGQVALLRASDAQAGDQFGTAAAISGDTIVVGAYGEAGGPGDPLGGSGAAYVFTRNQGAGGTPTAEAWGQVALLRASDAQALDGFGWSAAISGDTIVVGAYSEAGGPDDPLSYAGAAYVFSRNQGGADAWGEVNLLRAGDAQADDLFGIAVAISSDTLVVGARDEDGGPGNPLPDSGAAYVFSASGDWQPAGSGRRASDAQAGDEFGWSAAISGDTLVVGAPYEDGGPGDPLTEAGAAYVFTRNQGAGGTPEADAWGEVVILRASDAQVGDWFGAGVAISGDTIVVGADEEDGGPGNPRLNSGAAYVFTRNRGAGGTPEADAWGEVAILRASDAQDGDNFGSAVAISGDTIVVGARVPEAGAAYVFTRNRGAGGTPTAEAWGEVTILRASDAQASDYFGLAVAISGDTIVVGAPYESGGLGDPRTNAGAAYVFSRNQGAGGTPTAEAWGEVTILRASDAQASDYFGFAVAISSDTIVVGARGKNGGPGEPLPAAGAAYVFTRNQGPEGTPAAEAWGEVTILRASDAQAYDCFGAGVAISGETIVVGAYGEDGGPGNPLSMAGAAYVFTRNQGLEGTPAAEAWGQVRILRAGDAQTQDWFGFAVAISGDTIVVGAHGEDGGLGDPWPDSGAAYLFTRQSGWEAQAVPPPVERQPGDLFGAVALSGDTLVVGAPAEDGGVGDPLPEAGAAYVFYRTPGVGGGYTAWSQAVILRASDAQAGDRFGYRVAIFGDVIAVGAPDEDGGAGDPLPGAGAVYLFRRDQGGTGAWGQTQLLRASDAQTGDGFGSALSLDGVELAVGAPYEDGGPGDPRPDAGAVYLFRFTPPAANDLAPTAPHNWGQVGTLYPGDPQAGDEFGYALSLDGTELAIGAPGEDGGTGDPRPGAGAVYIFRFTLSAAGDLAAPHNWGQVGTLYPGDPQAGDEFGYALSLDGTELAIGAPGEDGGAGDPRPGAGAVYIFRFTPSAASDLAAPHNWGQVGALAPSPAPDAGDAFGASVTLSGQEIIISAPFEDGEIGHPITDTGAAYIFSLTLTSLARSPSLAGWDFVQTLRSPASQVGGNFGSLVALESGMAAIGAQHEDGSAQEPITDTGAAYVFALVHPNSVPLAANDCLSVPANSTAKLLDVLANDTDADGEALFISQISSPAHGSAVIQGQAILYTPQAGYLGPDSFTYTITDGNGGYAIGNIFIMVGNIVYLPLALKR